MLQWRMFTESGHNNGGNNGYIPCSIVIIPILLIMWSNVKCLYRDSWYELKTLGATECWGECQNCFDVSCFNLISWETISDGRNWYWNISRTKTRQRENLDTELVWKMVLYVQHLTLGNPNVWRYNLDEECYDLWLKHSLSFLDTMHI